MREDMQKIIVERPRVGSTLRNLKSGKRLRPGEVRAALVEGDDFDSGSRRAASKRACKYLNENLAPLRRYLHSQIGRPWDKVFSEIRQTLDTRSALGLHVMQHLYQFISVDTVMIDGVVYEKQRYGLDKVEGLYVHPASRLIRYIKPKPRPRWNWRYRDEEPNFVRQSRTTAYEKIEGLWFRLEYGFDEEGLTVLLAKRQCDSKTIRQIESGEFGAITPRPAFGWPPDRK